MKVIIDISEEIYNHTQEYEVGGFNQENDTKLFMAIKNGTPLDKVKAKFISSYPTNWAGEPELGGAACEFSLCRVLDILDNIGKESEEEKYEVCME